MTDIAPAPPGGRRVAGGASCTVVPEAGGLAESCRSSQNLSQMRLEGNAGLPFAFLTSSSCPRLWETKASRPRLACRSLCHLAPSCWWPKGAEVLLLHKHSPSCTRCSHPGCGQQWCESDPCEPDSSAPVSEQLGHDPQTPPEHLGGLRSSTWQLWALPSADGRWRGLGVASALLCPGLAGAPQGTKPQLFESVSAR